MSDGLSRCNVQTYSPGVLVGNWYEEMRLKEDKLKLFKKQKEGTTLREGCSTANPIALETLAARLQEPTFLNDNPDGPVRFADPVMLMNKKTGTALAIDLSPLTVKTQNQALVSGAAAELPQLRSTWVVQRCPVEDNAAFNGYKGEADILHYGQRVRIANENACTTGFYYLQSALSSGRCASQKQAAFASLGACADNVFVVSQPFMKRGGVHEGVPVRMGEPVVLLHSLTNIPLCCDGSLTGTAYGMECSVFCGYATTTFSRSRGAVATSDENIFFFSTGRSDGASYMKTRSSMTATNALTLPMSCGNGVKGILDHIREGALCVGGRVGLRALALSLNVACNEHRKTFLTRSQVHTHVSRLGVTLLPVELDALFRKFDHTGNNTVCVQEIMAELRGNMNAQRLQTVIAVYQQLTIEGEGSVDYKDMLNLYRTNAHRHPDVEDGLITREEAIFDFESCWPARFGQKLGSVTLQEFVEYYTDVSPATDDDERFITLLQNCWAIPADAEYLRGEPLRAIEVVHINDTTETIRIPDSLCISLNNTDAVKRLLAQHGVSDVKEFRVKRRC